MKYIFRITIKGENKKEKKEPTELTTIILEVDAYHTMTALEAEEKAIEEITESEVKEYHEKKTGLDITAEISLVKMMTE